MTSSQDSTSDSRILFERALDSLPPKRSDTILVLRNWDRAENAERLELASKLLADNWSGIMLLLTADNTKGEAGNMVEMMTKLKFKSVILVTHRYHSYRAYLTFIRWFRETGIKVYMKSVSSGVELGEREKIDEYTSTGDCATYEEGLEYLKWLSS